jgi:TPR repeat protein
MPATFLSRLFCSVLVFGFAVSCSKGHERMSLDDLVEAASQGDEDAMAELEKRTINQLNKFGEVIEGADITVPLNKDPNFTDAVTSIAEAAEALQQQFLEGKGKLHGVDGFTKDAEEGLRLLQEAAAAGHGEAAFGLGLAYRYGLEVEADLEAALDWYRKALAAGFTDAAEELAQVEKLLK